MKRLLALLLSLVMMFSVFAVLTSCGETENPPEPPAPEEPQEETKDYAWTEIQNINIKLNLIDGQFTNMVKRYMSGEDDRYASAVDEQIAERNEAAETVTKVHPNYLYWETDNGWGLTDEQIVADALAWDETCADVYCTAAYDTIGACIKGALANLSGTKRGNNYFTFIEEDYDATKDDEGYNYDFMRSFSPIPDKAMFILASDYTTDVFRALHAIPVSLTLLHGMDAADAIENFNVPDFDIDNDNEFNIYELIDYVWDGKWTWDTMAALCGAVYQPASEGAAESFGDTVFGFYFDVSGGSSGNALTYSTTFDHWSKEFDDNGVPTYTQYGYEAFQGFADAFTRLMDVKGALRVKNSDTAAFSSQKNACDAIGERFGRNEVLFGENIILGYIESSFYKEMKGSFGLLPQPRVEAATAETTGSLYTTALGNAARVISFGVNTDDFSAATAFVDYQSTHSDDIMKAYYRSQQYEATNGETYNIQMLSYIRTIMVSQEAQFMNLYTWNMGLTDEDLVAYDTEHGITTPADGYLNFNAGAMLTQITQTWRNAANPSTDLPNYYSKQYQNTMTALYRVVVDRYVQYAESN